MKYLVILLLIVTKISISLGVTINKEEPVFYFTNHASQLEELRNKLMQYSVVGITGIKGIGKSELARKYVSTYQQQYDLIAFIDMGSELIPQFLQIAKYINSELCQQDTICITENPNLIKQNLFSYLNNRENWLLIFDNLNVGENDKTKEFMAYQAKPKGHFIFCSQDSKYFRHKVEVPYLKKDNVIKIANQIMIGAPNSIKMEFTNAITGYPTYIVANGAIFLHNNNYVSIKDYMQYMKNEENKILAHLQVILKQLSISEKDLLFQLALLDTKRTPRNLLEKIANTKEEFFNKLHNINRFGIIEQISADRNAQIFRMHDAIREELLNLRGNKLIQQDIIKLLAKIKKGLSII